MRFLFAAAVISPKINAIATVLAPSAARFMEFGSVRTAYTIVTIAATPVIIG